MNRITNIRLLLLLIMVLTTIAGAMAQKNNKMDFKDNMTALEVYDATKAAGWSEANPRTVDPPRVNISGYAVKVGPDVYGLPSVEVAETKGGQARTLCVLPFMDYLKLRHVKKGDKVVITGNVLGYAPQYDIVVVKKCEIATVNDKKP